MIHIVLCYLDTFVPFNKRPKFSKVIEKIRSIYYGATEN
jgi:hypothetical protein